MKLKVAGVLPDEESLDQEKPTHFNLDPKPLNPNPTCLYYTLCFLGLPLGRLINQTTRIIQASEALSRRAFRKSVCRVGGSRDVLTGKPTSLHL